MNALVVDIETVGEPWEKIDKLTQKLLVDRILRLQPDQKDPEKRAQEELGLSPYTGEIVALGVIDAETSKGAVYFQAPGQELEEAQEGEIKLKVASEREILEKFWELADRYTTFVTFSGRIFDMPYLMLRSAIVGIKPKKDLMRNRYLTHQAPNAVHIDLHDQLSFYGSAPRLGGLHLACRAFGIDTPKDGEIDGMMVSEYYQKGQYEEIARYNARDIIATKELYHLWRKLLAF